MVERVEDARPAHAGKAEHRQRADMRFTKPRLKTAGQRRVREQRIEVDRGVRDRDDMRARRDRAVEERQCLAVVERADLGHEAREEIERAITFGREAGKRAPPVATLLRVRSIDQRSEEHTSELQSLMRISYAVFCLKKKNT